MYFIKVFVIQLVKYDLKIKNTFRIDVDKFLTKS